MPGQTVYLDTSALVKRYVKEDGSEIVDAVFKDADSNNAVIYSSFWCIGEAVGVFDRYDRKKVVKRAAVLERFFNEIKGLSAKGAFRSVDVTSELISQSIEGMVRHHIYIADALQIETCKTMGCDRFLTADKRLYAVAREEKIESVLLGR